MDNKVEVGNLVQLKTGGPAMRVERISDDALVAYCSWIGENEIKYVEVAFLISNLIQPLPQIS